MTSLGCIILLNSEFSGDFKERGDSAIEHRNELTRHWHVRRPASHPILQIRLFRQNIKPSPQRAVIEESQTVRCDWLAKLARADVLGRKCADKENLLSRVALFEDFSEENQCLNKSRGFSSDHSRFVYFHKQDSDLEYVAFDDTKCEVVMMEGLPGAGKDLWASFELSDLPVVSLDEIRSKLDVNPEDPQGEVASHAKERAKEYLRAGKSFVWNATNVSRQMREQIVRLFVNNKARVRIVYVETPY